MLPKANRLTKKKDFERVFRRGKRLKDKFLTIKILGNNLNVSRFGFIVSKKISKKAVLRNKIKRRLRESVLPKLSQIRQGVDVAVIAGPGIGEKNFGEIEEISNKILEKAGILRNRSLRSL
jgi:ribonuclease P protein component